MTEASSKRAARKGDVLRVFAAALVPYLREQLGLDNGAGPTFYSQQDSPLGRRRHLELVRQGVLAGHKVGRRVFVRREIVHAYIEAHRALPERPANDASDVLADWGLQAKGER